MMLLLVPLLTKIIQLSAQHLLCATCFMYMLREVYNNSLMKVTIIIPVFRRGNKGLERLSNSSKASQLISSDADVHIKIV